MPHHRTRFGDGSLATSFTFLGFQLGMVNQMLSMFGMRAMLLQLLLRYCSSSLCWEVLSVEQNYGRLVRYSGAVGDRGGR